MSEMIHNPLEGERPEVKIPLHNEKAADQVSIIIVHKDRPEYLNILLQSISVTSFNNNYEVIVVDNGSQGDEVQAFLEDISTEVKLVKNEKNLYWSAAANKGAAAADKNSKYLIFMHCDVVITNPGWIDMLVNVSEGQGSGMVGVELQTYYLGTQKVDFLQEYTCLFSRECWKDVGPWEEKLPQIGPAFLMTMKAQNKGYKPQILKTALVHHYRIFSLDINDYEILMEKAMSTIPKLVTDIRAEAV